MKHLFYVSYIGKNYEEYKSDGVNLHSSTANMRERVNVVSADGHYWWLGTGYIMRLRADTRMGKGRVDAAVEAVPF